MKFLAVIPARGGSKGIPDKNITDVAGKPLIEWTIKAAKECSSIHKIVVSTDSEVIADVARKSGVEVCMRPPELSQDGTPTLPVIHHVYENVKKLGQDFDAVVTLQPTSPLRTANHLKHAIEYFISHPEADSLVSVVKIPHQYNPESLMIERNNFFVPLNLQAPTRRQDKPVYYARNGAAIYITRISRLNDYIWGGKILGFEMDKLSSIDIDDAEDLQIASALLKTKCS